MQAQQDTMQPKLVLLMLSASVLMEAAAAIGANVLYYPDYKESVCHPKHYDRKVIDAWSASSLLFLRVNQSSDKLLVFDVNIRKYYDMTINAQLAPYIRKVQLNDTNSVLDLVQANVLKAIIESQTSPSILFFEPRLALRANCQNEWFYDPPDSKFCRRHPLVTDMDRVLVLVDNEMLTKPEKHQLQVFHTHRLRVEDFGETIYRHPARRSEQDVRDLLRQFITASVLQLQVYNKQAVVPLDQQSVRYHFSNRLGLFVAWPRAAAPNEHCAVLITVKLQPHIRICTRRASIISFFEFDSSLLVLLDSHRLVRLSHLYLKKQFRLLNNFNIDLDQLDGEDLFDGLFACNTEANHQEKVVEVTTKSVLSMILKG